MKSSWKLLERMVLSSISQHCSEPIAVMNFTPTTWKKGIKIQQEAEQTIGSSIEQQQALDYHIKILQEKWMAGIDFSAVLLGYLYFQGQDQSQLHIYCIAMMAHEKLRNIILTHLKERIHQLTAKKIARYVGDYIAENPDDIQYYALMTDQELKAEINLIWSESLNNTVNPEIKPEPKSKPKQQLIKPGPKQMGDQQQEEESVSSQIKPESKMKPKQRLVKTGPKSKPKQKFAPTPQNYVNKSIALIQEYKEFSPVFTQEFFKQFLIFYKQYESLPLIEANEIQGKVDRSNTLLYQINITDSALYYSSPNHRLRVTQVLAIYCFLSKSQLQKVLLQILTGEGKSTTIACLAAILAMRGHDVDIITTNKILAKRDAEQKRNFFQLMGLKVDHNICSQDRKSKEALNEMLKPRKCYEKGTVVYGIPYSYQVDLLYDEYKKKGTRNNRPYEIAIVDQVDSMFVDEKQHQTLLASTFSGFAELKDPLKIIWQTVISHNIVNENGKLYLIRHGKNKGDIIKGEVKQFLNLIIQEIRTSFKNDVINQEKLEFTNISLDDWILSAILAAYEYKKDIHYVIEKKKIIPVDFRNTGCLQKNVEWQNGLHQFLQMKHGLPISVQNMTSNYMSNIGHFCRYRRLYGLTGTLGSKKSMEFLKKVYQVAMFQIPPFHERRLKIEPGYVMYDHEGWINRICERCEFMMKQNRAVLLICLSIHQANTIEEEILERRVSVTNIVQMKTGEESNSDRIDCGDIIIATNVAGRGTDLKASEQLVKNGGLHVIIPFVPTNLRVQRQAQGRTSRNGAPGSTQIIMNLTEYSKQNRIPLVSRQRYNNLGMENLLSIILDHRNQRQIILMEADEERVKSLRAQDKIFETFCSATNKISDYQTNNAKRKAIEEEWAMLLKKGEHQKLSDQDKIQKANQFTKKVVNDSDSFYKPYHAVERGIQEMNKGRLDQAKKLFKQAQKDKCTKNIQAAGKIYQGAVIIKQDGSSPQGIKKGVEALAASIPILQQRKQMLKGLRMRDLPNQNQNIANQIEKSQKRKVPKSNYNHKKFVHQNSNKQDKQDTNNKDSQRDTQGKQMSKLMDPPEIRVIDDVQRHIRNQIKKIQKINLQEEQIDIAFKPLTQLIDTSAAKQDDQSDCDDIVPDLPLVPVITIKKKQKPKVPWWKRVFVFVLGVVQICIGALIVAATSGAAAGFGSSMIHSGITDCLNALFKPELCEDLKKYYSKKALQYGMAALMAGTEGLKQIYGAGRKGFTLIKNSTMSEVMKIAAANIQKGLEIGGFDIKGLVQHHIYKGLSDRLMKQDQKNEVVVPQIIKIIKRPDFKSQINKLTEEQETMERIGKQIQQKFEKDSEQIIKRIVSQEFNNFMGRIKGMHAKKQQIFILINKSFVQTFKNRFNENDRDQVYQEMRLFLSKNYQSQTFAADVIKKFGIDRLIIKAIQNISSGQDYQIVVSNANNQLHNKIVEQINKISQKYRSEVDAMLTKLQKEQNYLNSNNSISVGQYKRRCTQYEADVKVFYGKDEFLKKFYQQVKQVNKDKQHGLYLSEKFIRSGIISEGNIDRQKLRSANIHPYMKEALSRIQDFTPSDQDFRDKIKTLAYDNSTAIVVKALKSGTVSKLKKIQSKLNESLYGKHKD